MMAYACVLMIAAALLHDRVSVFVGAVLWICGAISFLAIGATWRFSEPCPYCRWNINIRKNFQLALFVPSICPNCGADLEVVPGETHGTCS